MDMAGLGAPELLLVLGAVMLLFGAKKLPEFARSLGKAKNEFKRGLDDDAPKAGVAAGEVVLEPKQSAPHSASVTRAELPE